MDLPRSLLKEFAEITNNNSKDSYDKKYVRGTVKSTDGNKYVQIDGSTTLTPISEVVDVEDGDRVLVTIENHSATILGNFTFPPSARKEQEAIDKADDAQNTANSANEAAVTAAEKAEEAYAKADSAIDSSASAIESANSAKQSAQEAIDAANTANTNASDAKQSATEAANSAQAAREEAANAQQAAASAQNEVTRINGEVANVKNDVSNALSQVSDQAAETAAIKETLETSYSTKTEVSEVEANLKTEISKEVGELQTTVEQNYAAKNDILELEGSLQSQITQNAEGITSTAQKVEKLESDTTEAQAKVDQALESAANAQSTAEQAQSAAAKAQSDADLAKENAATANQKAQNASDSALDAKLAAHIADEALADARTALDEARRNYQNVVNNPESTAEQIQAAQTQVDTAIEAVNAALENAAEAAYVANQAQEAANQAASDAAQAQTYATNAQMKADNASLAADKAKEAADKAQADVAALTSRVTEAETSIKQNADAIELSASKVEEIGNKVDNIEVGGRNFIINSTFSGMTGSDKNDGALYEIVNDELRFTFDNFKENILFPIQLNLSDYFMQNTIGEKYVTVSFDYKILKKLDIRDGKPGPEIFTRVALYGANDLDLKMYGQTTDLFPTDETPIESQLEYEKDPHKVWIRLSRTFKLDEDLDYDRDTEGLGSKRSSFNINIQDISNGILYIRHPKVEFGSVPTEWTQAPEDIDNNLKNNYYTKTETDAQFKIESDKITSTVTTTVNTEITSVRNSGKNMLLDSTGDLYTGWNIYAMNMMPDGSMEESELNEDTGIKSGEGLYGHNAIVLKQDDVPIIDMSNPVIPDSGIRDVIISHKTEMNGQRDPLFKDGYTLSFWIYIDDSIKFNNDLEGCTNFVWTIKTNYQEYQKQFNLLNIINSESFEYNKWVRFDCYWICPNINDNPQFDFDKGYLESMSIDAQFITNCYVKMCMFQVEHGAKASSWSPAAEDLANTEEVKNAQETADDAASMAESNESRLSISESTIQQLSDSISMLVTDENGNSMMTQTSDGWTFNIGEINETLNNAKDELNNLSGSVDEADNAIKNLNSLVNDLSQKTAYIIMTTDETGAPCIELGKSDNDFKVRITNTSVDFMDGSSRIAYVSNQALYIERAIIKDELQIGEGEGYIWKRRSNGNMGLRWVGGDN